MHEFFGALNIVVAIGFLISGLDDLFIDAFYWIRELFRKVALKGRIQPIPEAELTQVPEKWVAIWIPAWHEDEVIDKMLMNTLESLNYSKYDIFVGTYPNDEPTQLAVESVRERHPQVRKIVCPNPGPTNKADCLNWVYQGMLLAEQERGFPYEIVVLHDSEDIVHPLELKLFNWLLPRKDMVQIPVIPLEMPARYWTAGTYLDEFSENHFKDLLVRERLSTIVPSAGVGTGLSRALLNDMARLRHNQLFNINSLTEDYEFCFGLLPLNRKSIIVRYTVERTQTVTRGVFRKKQVFRQVQEPVAVHEYFPDSFRLAVRQKSRWVLGISIQGWKNLGWTGGFWNRYMLYRDRKSLFTNPVNFLGCVVLGYWVVYGVTIPWVQIPSIVPSSWIWNIMLIDTALMFHRLLERFIAVLRVAGVKQAMLSIPRTIVGNAINFCATFVAIKQAILAKKTGKRTPWQKTKHSFPTAAELREHRRRLGDLLLENRLVSVAQLREALEVQQKSGQKLGEVLTGMGYVSEEDLLRLVGKQLRMPALAVDVRTIDPAWLKKLPRKVAEEKLVLPLRFVDGVLDVVSAHPAVPGLKLQLEGIFGCPIRLGIAGENAIRFAITRVYMSSESGASVMLGELLVAAGAITRAQLRAALAVQERTGQKLGEVLQDQGLLSPQLLAAALDEQETATLAEIKG